MSVFYQKNARWLLGGFLLTMFSGFGQTFFISIWGSEIRTAFELSHGEFGLLYMMATLASASLLPFVGRLVDFTSVSISSVIVIAMLAAASFSMSVAASVPMLFLTIFLLRLFGQGMMTHTSMTAMGRWYVQNRGKAVSCATIGHQFSEAIGPTLFVALSVAYGWRETWMIASVCLVVIALPLIYALMRVERVPRTRLDEDTKALETGRQWTRAEMLRDPLFWLAGTGVFAPAFIGTSIFFHQDYLIEINGWSAAVYYQSFAIMAATTVVFSLITGVAVDRWSAVRLLPTFMLPLGIACLVLGTVASEATIFIFMVMQGVSYGITSTLFGALWPEVYGTRHLGSLRAITVSFMVFMSAAGPGLTGALIDWGVPFSHQLISMAIFCFVAIFFMSVASRGFERRVIG